jgi:putative methionine-R-sulfoxide reductase with GAF domain
MYDPLVVDKFIEVLGELAHTEPERSPSDMYQGSSFCEVSGDCYGYGTSSLFQFDALIRNETSLLQMASLAIEFLKARTGAHAGVFYLNDVKSLQLIAKVVRPKSLVTLNGLCISLGHRVSGWVGANRKPILNADAALDLGDAARRNSLTSSLSTAIVYQDSLLGVVTLYGDQFQESDQRMCENVTKIIAERTLDNPVSGVQMRRL